MYRKKPRVLLIIVAVAGFTAFLYQAHLWVHEPVQRVDPKNVRPKDYDRDSYPKLERLRLEGSQLIEQGGATDPAVLRKQLDRRQCTLSLAEPSSSTLTPEQIYERKKSAVLILGNIYKCKKCDKWHLGLSTGFVISATGAFVTSYHVLKNGRAGGAVVAMTSDGALHPVREVLAASLEDDVVIAQLGGADVEWEPLALSTEAPVGSPVSVIGHPRNRLYTLTQGHVSRHYSGKWPNGKIHSVMTVTADIAAGSSGAPTIDRFGNAVGLAKSTSTAYTSDGYQQMVFKECAPTTSILKLIEPR